MTWPTLGTATEIETKVRIDQLFERMKALSLCDKAGVLAYMCGWCEFDQTFADGLERYLMKHHTEVF